MKKQAGRSRWVDFVRGVAMILVIIGHCGLQSPHFDRLYMFHLPLFYIISGYCHAWGRYQYDSFGKTLGKIFRTYLLPYYVLSAIGLAVTALFPQVYSLEGGVTAERLRKYLTGILYARGYNEYTAYWGAVWFLFSQSWVMLFAFLSDKLKKPLATAAMICVLLAVNEYLRFRVFFLSPGWLPFNLGAAVTALPLFYAGTLIRERLEAVYDREGSVLVRLLFCGIVIAAGFSAGATNNSLVGFSENYYGNICVMYVSSIMIVTGIFGLAKLLYAAVERCRPMRYVVVFQFVEWIGKRTIPFLGIHCLTLFFANILLGRLGIAPSWPATTLATIAIDSVIIALYDAAARPVRARLAKRRA